MKITRSIAEFISNHKIRRLILERVWKENLNTNNYFVTHIKSMLHPQDHVAYSIAQNDRRLYERIMKEKKTGVQPMTQLHRSQEPNIYPSPSPLLCERLMPERPDQSCDMDCMLAGVMYQILLTFRVDNQASTDGIEG